MFAYARLFAKLTATSNAPIRPGAKVTATAGECLFLPFVASRGYSVTVNGKKAELIDNDLKLLSVALQEGENVVEFVYSSPYVKYAGVGALAAVAALLVVAFVLKKTKLFALTAPVVSWAGIVLSVAVVSFFMLFPLTVFVTKLVSAFPFVWEQVSMFFGVFF